MRYLLFGGEFFYAKGGARDIKHASNSVDRLKEEAESDGDLLWWHIFDTKTGLVIDGTTQQAHGSNDLVIK